MSAMHERVRDDSGTWTSGTFALGAVVLHTTTESLEAAQPLASADGSLVLAMDGFLTNWEELRRDLLARGAVLRNRSDGELVLHAYQLWGEDCAVRLEGEFAIILADQRRQRIFAARDHQGLRPLYVYEDEQAVLFASELSAIIAASQRAPAPNMDYLAGIAAVKWYQRDATVWRGIERVPQSHWMIMDRSGRRVQRYYAVPEEVTLHYRREEDYVDHYRSVLIEAVRRTARSHRPLAIAVSGGLDSSAIYCIADRLEREGRLPAPGLQGYALAGEEGTDAYELPYARAAAEHCGRTLVEAPLFLPPIDWFINRARAECDVPIPYNGAMSIGIEQRAKQDGSVVFLNGTGGDQWLDGTAEYYAEFARAFDVAGFAGALLRDVRVQGWRTTLPLALRLGASPFVPRALRLAVRRHRRERRYRDPADMFWMRPEWRERLLDIEAAFVADLPEAPRAQGNWNRVYSPYNTFVRDLIGRQRARFGIESRDPMFSRGFIEFCASAPKALFREGETTKVLHRKAMRGILPDRIVDRMTKAEFSVPGIRVAQARRAQDWAPGVLGPFCDLDGLKRLTGSGGKLTIDPQRGWAVWGVYAVAAFLMNIQLPVSDQVEIRDGP